MRAKITKNFYIALSILSASLITNKVFHGIIVDKYKQDIDVLKQKCETLEKINLNKENKLEEILNNQQLILKEQEENLKKQTDFYNLLEETTNKNFKIKQIKNNNADETISEENLNELINNNDLIKDFNKIRRSLDESDLLNINNLDSVDESSTINKDKSDSIDIDKIKTRILDLDLIDFIDNFNKFLKSLTMFQLIAVFNISTIGVILTSVLSIYPIFISDYIIKYFKIEEKYPKLGKFIQLRKTFNRYYAIFNILVIVGTCLVALYVNFIILF